MATSLNCFTALPDNAISSNAVQEVMGVLKARAREGAFHEVYVRVAFHDGTIYVDLGTDAHEVVAVSPGSWRIIGDPPVKFRRPVGMRPLPHPVGGGDLTSLLRPFAPVASEDDIMLVTAFVLGTLQPSGPMVVLSLSGEQGSAKTTTSRNIRNLTDPNDAPVRRQPRDERDLVISASNGWIVAYDNLSGIPAWLSDAMCTIATGSGFSTRQLFSDDDEVLFSVRRPQMLNGIAEAVTRPDLADRTLFIELAVIADAARSQRPNWSERLLRLTPTYSAHCSTQRLMRWRGYRQCRPRICHGWPISPAGYLLRVHTSVGVKPSFCVPTIATAGTRRPQISTFRLSPGT